MTTKIVIDKEDLIKLIRMANLDYEDCTEIFGKNKSIVVCGFENAGDICTVDYVVIP